MARPLLQQPLHAGWRFRAADARLGDTEQFTAPDGWHAATVPGTVYQDLIDSGALPDPLIGRQETAVQWWPSATGATGWTSTSPPTRCATR